MSFIEDRRGRASKLWWNLTARIAIVLAEAGKVGADAGSFEAKPPSIERSLAICKHGFR